MEKLNLDFFPYSIESLSARREANPVKMKGMLERNFGDYLNDEFHRSGSHFSGC